MPAATNLPLPLTTFIGREREIGEVSANFMLRGSQLHSKVCGVCAEACARCAQSCEQLGNDAQMQACAQECRRCEESCRQMASMK